MRCKVPLCVYNTDEDVDSTESAANKIAMLNLHHIQVHPPHPATQPVLLATAAQPLQRKRKLDRPKLSAGSSQHDWNIFLRKWENYKTGMGIADTQVTPSFLDCLDSDLQNNFYSANPDVDIATIDVKEVISQIRELAVKTESVLVTQN